MIGKKPFQELPLLPGEYEFLAEKGWLTQFDPFEHRVMEFPLESGMMRAESIVSKRPNCACDHEIRPTVCRLYPLLPVFDRHGRLIATEPLSIYEEMEIIEGIKPICEVKSLSFEQFDKFLKIATQLGGSPIHLFYLEAYRRAKRHVAERLSTQRDEYMCDVFSAFENALIRRRLTDSEKLKIELNDLAREFKRLYGEVFNFDNSI
jgi:hypothetical protein